MAKILALNALALAPGGFIVLAAIWLYRRYRGGRHV